MLVPLNVPGILFSAPHYSEWLTAVFCDSTTYFGEVTRLPDLVIIMSTKTTVFDDHLAVRDSAKMLIPTIGICDSNADPRLVRALL